jgi:hypothetical protein
VCDDARARRDGQAAPRRDAACARASFSSISLSVSASNVGPRAPVVGFTLSIAMPSM